MYLWRYAFTISNINILWVILKIIVTFVWSRKYKYKIIKNIYSFLTILVNLKIDILKNLFTRFFSSLPSIEKLNKRHGDIDIVDYCLLSEYSILVTGASDE